MTEAPSGPFPPQKCDERVHMQGHHKRDLRVMMIFLENKIEYMYTRLVSKLFLLLCRVVLHCLLDCTLITGSRYLWDRMRRDNLIWKDQTVPSIAAYHIFSSEKSKDVSMIRAMDIMQNISHYLITILQ